MVRSIPAHAGEPQRFSPWRSPSTVYPRPRGGTPTKRGKRLVSRGLSPPTRGNQGGSCRAIYAKRSIPAHAGEPAHDSFPEYPRAVYPRPRGGTRYALAWTSTWWGLSPPTRGNLNGNGRTRVVVRSIPAHAGEPEGAAHGHPQPAVYPRPRGGTASLQRSAAHAVGLSPPTRGNPPVRKDHMLYAGSIPAHAGEPVTPVSE